MRSLWYLPLTFLAGVHGFAIFAPYLVVVYAALHLRRVRRSRARAAAAQHPVAPVPTLSRAGLPNALPALIPA